MPNTLLISCEIGYQVTHKDIPVIGERHQEYSDTHAQDKYVPQSHPEEAARQMEKSPKT